MLNVLTSGELRRRCDIDNDHVLSTQRQKTSVKHAQLFACAHNDSTQTIPLIITSDHSGLELGIGPVRSDAVS